MPIPTTLAELPVTLRPARIRYLLLLLFCVAITWLGVFIAIQGGFVGYLLAILFGVGCVAFAINLHPRAAYLELSRDGFTITSLFRRRTTLWRTVDRFGVFKLPGIVSTSMVGFNYALGVRPESKTRLMSRAVAGYEAALPDSYGMKPQALAALLQHLRDQAVTAGTAGHFGLAETNNTEA